VRVTDKQIERDIPHEPGQRMTFRPLSGDELDEAERAATRHVVESVAGIDLSGIKRPDEEPSQEDRRHTQYDASIIVKYGVVAWSYEFECNNANKRLLDAHTRNWARDVILEMNTRSEEERGNSVASSSEGASQVNFEVLTNSDSEA